MNPWARKPRQQPLGDSLLQVQVDGVFAEYAGVLEDHRPDRRNTAPVHELLIGLAGHAQRVQGRGPARVGRGPLVERGEGPDRAAVLVGALLERRRAQQLQRARERLAKRRCIEPRPVP